MLTYLKPCMCFSSALLSAGERTLVDLGGAAEVTAPSQPEIPPAASVLEAPPQAQTVPAEEGPERIEGTLSHRLVTKTRR